MSKHLHSLFEQNWQFTEQTLDWETAIQLVGEPLINNKYIEQRYIAAIINNVKKIGAYFIIADEFALPHARSENGVLCLETKFSLLKCKNPVIFPEGEPVSLFIMLAAGDNDKHLDAISELISWLEENNRLEKIINSKTESEFEHFLF